MSLRDVTSSDTVTSEDSAVGYSVSAGANRRWTWATIINFLNTNLSPFTFFSQRVSVTATGQTVTVNNSSQNVRLIIEPSASYAAMTILLPAVANAVDNQQVVVTCSQSITTLTVNGNGASLVSDPSSLGTNSNFTMMYSLSTQSWYLVS